MKKTLKSIGVKATSAKSSYIEFARKNHNPANKIGYDDFLKLIRASQETKLKKAS
jgi:hypothetical protein